MFEDESQPQSQPQPQPLGGLPAPQSPDEIPDIFDGSGSTGEHMPDASPETTMHGPSALAAGKLQPLPESASQQMGQMGLPPETTDLHEPTAIKRIILATVILIVVALIGAAVWYFVIREPKSVPPTPVVTTPTQPAPTEQPPTDTAPTTDIVDVDVTELTKPEPATSTPVTIPEPLPQVNPQTDTDKDGLNDAKEDELGTNTTNPDTDGDGLTDGAEVSIWGTDPLNKDSDGDTFPDGQEVLNGFNPKGSGKLR